MSRVRSRYEIERSALAQAAARHAAVAARVERAMRTYRAQDLDVARSMPAVKSIAGRNSTQVVAEIQRLESSLAAFDRSATSELDRRCRTAYEEAFAAAKAQLDTDAPEAILGHQRIERRERRRDRTAPDRALPDAIAAAEDTIDRVIARLAERATAESRARVVELAAMVTEATSSAEVERVVLAVRTAVGEANDLAADAEQRSQQIDAWHERLHPLISTEARDLEERIRRLDPDTPLPGGLAEQIERELVVVERQDGRQRALAATRSALESLGYGVSDGFTEEAFGGDGSLATIPDKAEHMVRVRERRGALLMDVVRVVGEPTANTDLAAEQALCDSLDDLAIEARRNGVTLVMKAELADGDLDFVERRLPASPKTKKAEGSVDVTSGSKRAKPARSSMSRARERGR